MEPCVYVSISPYMVLTKDRHDRVFLIVYEELVRMFPMPDRMASAIPIDIQTFAKALLKIDKMELEEARWDELKSIPMDKL